MNSTLPFSALSTLRLVTSPAAPLRRLHPDLPALRPDLCGHKVAIKLAWQPMMARWTHVERGDLDDSGRPLFAFGEPHTAVVHVTRSQLDAYLARKGLMFRRAFVRMHGDAPWTRAEVAYRAHARIQARALKSTGSRLPLGRACLVACEGHSAARRAEHRLGMLPVQAVTYTRMFALMLHRAALTLRDWGALSDEQRDQTWTAGDEHGEPWSFDAVARLPAVLSLPGYEFENDAQRA